MLRTAVPSYFGCRFWGKHCCPHLTKVRVLQAKLPSPTIGMVFYEKRLTLNAQSDWSRVNDVTRLNFASDALRHYLVACQMYVATLARKRGYPNRFGI